MGRAPKSLAQDIQAAQTVTCPERARLWKQPPLLLPSLRKETKCETHLEIQGHLRFSIPMVTLGMPDKASGSGSGCSNTQGPGEHSNQNARHLCVICL